MRIFKSFSLTCFSLIFTVCSAFCQTNIAKPNNKVEKEATGYIINWSGDTIKSEFKGSAFPDLKYRTLNSSGTFQHINIGKVKSWYSSIDSTVYQTMYIDSTTKIQRYFSVLEEGTINLYVRYDLNNNAVSPSLSSGKFYFSHCDGNIRTIPVNTKEIKDFFYNQFGDDKEYQTNSKMN